MTIASFLDNSTINDRCASAKKRSLEEFVEILWIDKLRVRLLLGLLLSRISTLDER